jgi:hypothetical protein
MVRVKLHATPAAKSGAGMAIIIERADVVLRQDTGDLNPHPLNHYLSFARNLEKRLGPIANTRCSRCHR